MPGTLDLAVLEGSRVPDDCKWLRPPTSDGLGACVIFPPNLSNQMLSGYRRSLEASGWTFSREADPYFLFDRLIPDSDCTQRLVVTGRPFATISELLAAQRSGTVNQLDAVLYFQFDPQPRCNNTERPG